MRQTLYIFSILIVIGYYSVLHAATADTDCHQRDIILTNATSKPIFLTGYDIQRNAIIKNFTVGDAIEPYSRVGLALVADTHAQGNVIAFLYFSYQPQQSGNMARVEIVYNTQVASHLACYENVYITQNSDFVITSSALSGQRQLIFTVQEPFPGLSRFLSLPQS